MDDMGMVMYGVIIYTPPKTNMEPKNEDLEDVFSFSHPLAMVFWAPRVGCDFSDLLQRRFQDFFPKKKLVVMLGEYPSHIYIDIYQQ